VIWHALASNAITHRMRRSRYHRLLAVFILILGLSLVAQGASAGLMTPMSMGSASASGHGGCKACDMDGNTSAFGCHVPGVANAAPPISPVLATLVQVRLLPPLNGSTDLGRDRAPDPNPPKL